MKRYSMIAAAALLTLMSVTDASSQVIRSTASAPEAVLPPTWTVTVGRQITQLLASPSPAVRQQALHLAMYLPARYGTQVDLKAAVPALLTVYRTDADEQNRIASAVALRAIGDERGMQQLRRRLGEAPSARVRYVTFALLRDFYGIRTFEGDRSAAEMAQALLLQYRPEPAATLALR
jgi:HEAT repeat protein